MLPCLSRFYQYRQIRMRNYVPMSGTDYFLYKPGRGLTTNILIVLIIVPFFGSKEIHPTNLSPSHLSYRCDMISKKYLEGVSHQINSLLLKSPSNHGSWCFCNSAISEVGEEIILALHAREQRQSLHVHQQLWEAKFSQISSYLNCCSLPFISV